MTIEPGYVQVPHYLLLSLHGVRYHVDFNKYDSFGGEIQEAIRKQYPHLFKPMEVK